MSILSERLKNLRENSNMKQLELAEKLCISRSNIAKYETGIIPSPPLDILLKYADLFETSLDYIVGRTDEEKVKITKNENIEIGHDKEILFSDEDLQVLEEAINILKKRGV